MGSGKKRRAPVIIIILLFIFIVLPLIVLGSSFIGRITPDSVIPDSFDFYADVPEPARFFERLLNHAPLPDIMALAELTPLVSQLNQIKDSKLAENRFIRFIARGRLNAAFLPGNRIIAAWDAGIASPLLKFLPALIGRMTIPGLYYVQAGKNSRFEYHLSDGQVYYIGTYKNLLLIANNSALYESVIAGTGDRYGSGAKQFSLQDYDIALLLSPEALKNILASGGDPDELLSGLNLLQFPGPIQLGLSILPNRLNLRIASPLGTDSQALKKIIERNSGAAPLAAMVPDSAQYLTLLSAGSLDELFNAASAVSTGTAGGGDFGNALRRADSSARITLGMNLEELLFSWTGSQFAVYGLEGRPNPVIVLEIKDETKRKEVFDKAFRSLFLNENVQLNLDGNRIPRIQIPSFLNAFLSLLDLNVPSPYYTVQNNYLIICESAETLLAAVNAVRRNDVLPGSELWRTLSEGNSGPSSFSLFYSLDRSLPFFLKGSSVVPAVLKLYHQGLARLRFENNLMNVSLSVIPGAGKGLVPVPGYPLDLSLSIQGGSRTRIAKGLFSISRGKNSRLILTRATDVLSVNPIDRSITEYSFSGSPGAQLYVLPFEAPPGPAGTAASTEAAAWVVNSQGQVSLVNLDMEDLRGFPLTTGIQISAPPAAWGGKLFLGSEDGSVHTVDSRASVSRWGRAFASALRAPPSFLDFKNKTYAAVYPKSLIFAEIILLDAEGNTLPAWPVQVPGIAFGSPLLFSTQFPDRQDRLFAAFITQAGELSVYMENAEILHGFPVELPGVFYLQPVFDGECLWIIESEGTLYKISLGAEVLSQKIPRSSVKEEGCITIAGIDAGRGSRKDAKGPIGEVFFSGEGNALYGYSRNFSTLDGFPLPIWGQPVFGDLNGDGKIEVAGTGMDSKLYMWQFR